MKFLKYLTIIILLFSPFYGFADAKVSISGSQYKVIEIKPETNTGLNNIFVVYDTDGCTLKYASSNGYTTNVYRYSNLGGGYAEEISNVDREVSSVSFPLTADDLGYIIEEGSNRYYCWVVNYANHKFSISSLTPSSAPECEYSVLEFAGSASPIHYFTINGQSRVLSREIYLDYTTQEYDKEVSYFKNVDIRKVLESVSPVVSVTPPAYCSTYFTLTGDRFLREWNMAASAETNTVQPYAVDCYTEAVQNEKDFGDEGSNIIKGDESTLGGSAPAEISFTAATTEAVIHYEWQMSRDQEFDNPEYRFYQKDLDYTFTDDGTFYLRFVGSNADGTCSTYGDIFTVSIGASELKCPNAFSPNGDGVNDVWKVSYRSLIEFSCEIFNRNGQKIYGFTDPTDGWDGTWHGKTVKPGVYYYVIIATGADGKKYKKSGDINIINSVTYSSGSTIPDVDYTE